MRRSADWTQGPRRPPRGRASKLGSWLVFEGNDGATVATEGGDLLQVAVVAGNGHDRAVAVDGMAAGGEIPASALGPFADLSGGLAQGPLRSHLHDGQT